MEIWTTARNILFRRMMQSVCSLFDRVLMGIGMDTTRHVLSQKID